MLTIHVPLFSLEETVDLLTDPFKYADQWSGNDAARPRNDLSYWGEEGIEAVFRESGGWPHLVQLIAETIYDLTNECGAQAVDKEICETAFDRAINIGDIVLRELIYGESKTDNERNYLEGFKSLEVQIPPLDDETRQSLVRRELVVEADGQWRLRVPLMRRWMLRQS